MWLKYFSIGPQMFRRIVLSTFLALFILASVGVSESSAQTRPRAGVCVAQEGEDAVGSRLAYAVREELRKSAGYDVVERSKCLYRISLISLDLASGSESQGVRSTVSVVVTMTNLLPLKASDPQTWYPIYLTSGVFTVGSSRVDDQAKSVMALLDQAVEDFKAATRGK
jgi:hypothetical protein